MHGLGGIGRGMRGLGTVDITASTSALKAGYSAGSTASALTSASSLTSSGASFTKYDPSYTSSSSGSRYVDPQLVATGIQAAGAITGTIASAVQQRRAIAAEQAMAEERRKRQHKASKQAGRQQAAPAALPAPEAEPFPWVTLLLVGGAVGGAYLLTRNPAPPSRLPRGDQ